MNGISGFLGSVREADRPVEAPRVIVCWLESAPQRRGGRGLRRARLGWMRTCDCSVEREESGFIRALGEGHEIAASLSQAWAVNGVG